LSTRELDGRSDPSEEIRNDRRRPTCTATREVSDEAPASDEVPYRCVYSHSSAAASTGAFPPRSFRTLRTGERSANRRTRDWQLRGGSFQEPTGAKVECVCTRRRVCDSSYRDIVSTLLRLVPYYCCWWRSERLKVRRISAKREGQGAAKTLNDRHRARKGCECVSMLVQRSSENYSTLPSYYARGLQRSGASNKRGGRTPAPVLSDAHTAGGHEPRADAMHASYFILPKPFSRCDAQGRRTCSAPSGPADEDVELELDPG